MITKIGIWEIDEDGLTGIVNSSYDYNIAKERLWETRDFNGHIVWEWLIHLTEKDWITKDNIHELNSAFFFGQDYFKNSKPNDNQYISSAQTIFVQQQIMTIREKMERFEKSKKTGARSTDTIPDYYELVSQIKYLNL